MVQPLESNYKCLNIRCKDVGGLYDAANGRHMAYAGPCSGGSRYGVSAVVVALVVTVVFGIPSMFIL